ncbi:hypothetical protein MKK63_25160 [Methylobacterium sp. J-088]|uniref:hypothetical protein n=1 Tax=Methylobacterium sp. J-088 TaxID=2836664 RepID=UPI001FBA01FD|nr:hypothetical protein [Methylobacterium sp. J-088]MCJ2065971.1 hypothetical protein [Methylobacterium sp. J-088]
MYNCQIGTLCSLIKQLTVDEIKRGLIVREREELADRGIDPRRSPNPDTNSRYVSDDDIANMHGWLKSCTRWAVVLDDANVRQRIKHFEKRLERPIQHYEFQAELRATREAFEDAVNPRLFFLYDKKKIELFGNWKTDWAPVLEAFPSSVPDVFYALDCYCNENNTASVFHSMRVVEHGLRSLAQDLSKDFGAQNWQNVIDQIEAQIKSLGKTLPSGPDKSEKLRFYSTAAREITFFKDGWRNHVSHGHATYDETEARNVIEHVKHFMVGLSRNLREVSA